MVISSKLPVDDIKTEHGAADGKELNGHGGGGGGSRVLVAALHAYLYTIPNSHLSILYISKLDSSGHAPTALPITRTLITSFITYHVQNSTRPTSRVQACLFARSQGQYLFANSAKVVGKRVSGGLALCGWWKSVYEEVTRRVVGEDGKTRHQQNSTSVGNGGSSKVDEIAPTIDPTQQKTQDKVNLAKTGNSERSNDRLLDTEVKLKYLLPSYSASEAAGMLRTPVLPLPRGIDWKYAPPFDSSLYSRSTNKTGTVHESSPSGPSLSKIIPSLPDDPKTRFLDELVSSAITIIPSNQAKEQNTENDISASPSKKRRRTDKAKDREEAERRMADSALTRVGVDEFWERMGFRQECACGDVTGFFSLEVISPSSGSTSLDPVASTTDLPLAIVDRLHTALLNCDFGSKPLAIEGTDIWISSAQAIVTDQIGSNGWKVCTSEFAAKEGLQNDPVVKRKDEVVTMLQPRKKKKV